MNYLKTLVAVFLIFAGSTINAAEPQGRQHLTIQQNNGLVVTIPESGAQEITKALSSHRTDLEKRRSATTMQIESTKIDAKDAVIAVILPGGLIYLANKKQRHNLAKENLQAISTQLAELRVDMNYFALKSTTQAIALLK